MALTYDQVALSTAWRRIRKLEAALEPFAEAGRNIDAGPASRDLPDTSQNLLPKPVTVGDLRNARDVYDAGWPNRDRQQEGDG